MEPDKKRNVFNRKQARQLEDWLLSQWDRVEAERPTQANLAERAAKELNFAGVGPWQIRSAVNALGKEYPAPHKTTGGNGKLSKSAKKRWQTITDALVGLHRKLGEACPNELIELKNDLYKTSEL